MANITVDRKQFFVIQFVPAFDLERQSGSCLKPIAPVWGCGCKFLWFPFTLRKTAFFAKHTKPT